MEKLSGKEDGDEFTNLMKQLYGNADEKTRIAMNKSFQ